MKRILASPIITPFMVPGINYMEAGDVFSMLWSLLLALVLARSACLLLAGLFFRRGHGRVVCAVARK